MRFLKPGSASIVLSSITSTAISGMIPTSERTRSGIVVSRVCMRS